MTPYDASNFYNPTARPTFAQGVYNIPFGKDPYWGNPIDNSKPYVESVANKPFDSAVWAAQNIAMPYAAYTGVNRILGPGSHLGLWDSAKALPRGQGIAAGFGHGLGRGAATGLGFGARTAGFAAGIGGIASGLALPLAVGAAGMQAFDAGIADPYIFSRKNAENLNANFGNAYFGQGIGGAVSGKGLSYSSSARMGATIQRQGLQDIMFSREEYGEIANLSSQAGLLDNVKGSQITDRIKDVAAQIKLLVSVSNDPDVRSAISSLAQLQLSGASLSGGRSSSAARAYANLGGFAAQAGTTIQSLMRESAAGAAMYGQSGMTPYLGQLAHAGLFAGFAGGQRAGVMSPSLLASMGGLGGAAGLALSAQMRGAQSPLGYMAGSNLIFGDRNASNTGTSGKNLSLPEALRQHSARAAQNPLKEMGRKAMYGPAIAAAEVARGGDTKLENDLLSVARDRGKHNPSVEELMAIGISMGHSEDELRAYFTLRATQQTPEWKSQALESAQGFGKEQIRQYAAQNNLASPWQTYVKRPLGNAAKAIGGYLSERVEPFNLARGEFSDLLEKAGDAWGFSNVKDSVHMSDVEGAFAEKPRSTTTNFFSSTGLSSDWLTDPTFAIINNLAKKGNKDAIDYLNATSEAGRDKALSSLLPLLGAAGEKLSYSKDAAGALKARRHLESKVSQVDRAPVTSTVGASERAAMTASLQETFTASGIKKGSLFTGTGAEDQVQQYRTIGGALDLKAKLEKGEITGTKMLELVKTDPKYSNILAQAKITSEIEGRSLDEVIGDLVMGLATSSGALGSSGLAKQIFNSTGTGKMSGSEATSALKSAIGRMGGVAVGAKLKTTLGLTGTESGEIGQIGDNLSEAMSRAQEAASKSDVNYEGLLNTFKTIDAAAGTFAGAVKMFGDKVGEMNNTQQGGVHFNFGGGNQKATKPKE